LEEDAEIGRQAEEIDRHLRTVRRVLQRPVEAEVARGGLTGPQLSVMRVLAAAEGLSLKELSRRVGLAHSTVSGIVDRLERRGLVERSPATDDRRVTRLTVSDAVRTYLRDEWPRLRISPLVEALRRAGPAERAAALAGLATLRRLLEAVETEAAAEHDATGP
jgi:DNA-binding MarR family transcriptional regulator